ncbi:MAG: D-alanyl-D-alanine carboxypeptidase family protein [Gammaproteobacteria bacterium]|nr:D-alanyl-D-alanine carboxypeptidase family protein [Gammaproteobacteria bacterium]
MRRAHPLGRPRHRWLLAAVSLLVCSVAIADDDSIVPAIDARAYVLVDATSGAVLAASAADQPLNPASLTKLMTAYLVFEALENGRLALDDLVRVSEKAWRATGSRMFIEVDSDVVVSDLLRGLIIQSGNDAAIALAEHLAGSEDAFVERMNETAATLGMTGSHFRNTTGLPASGHVSTANDLALLARVLIDDYPQYYSLYSEREFTFNQITQHNRNSLLWRDGGVDGLKTGYTSAAGYCLVSSATRDGMRLIAVVLGASTAAQRAAGSQALLDYGFASFETHKIYSKGQALAEAKVWKGSDDTLSLGLDRDLYVTVPRGRYDALAATMALHANLVAPIAAFEPVGEVELSLGDQVLSVLPLVALDTVDEGWLLTRVADGIALWFE